MRKLKMIALAIALISYSGFEGQVFAQEEPNKTTTTRHDVDMDMDDDDDNGDWGLAGLLGLLGLLGMRKRDTYVAPITTTPPRRDL